MIGAEHLPVVGPLNVFALHDAVRKTAFVQCTERMGGDAAPPVAALYTRAARFVAHNAFQAVSRLVHGRTINNVLFLVIRLNKSVRYPAHAQRVSPCVRDVRTLVSPAGEVAEAASGRVWVLASATHIAIPDSGAVESSHKQIHANI